MSSECVLQTVRLRISEGDSLTLSVSEPRTTKLSISEVLIADSYEEWPGPYEVVPMVSEQSLETSGHVMRDDLVVSGIPHYEVSNDYGVTVSIG